MSELNDALLGPWVRRFLTDYMVTVRNCSPMTRRSYRDTYRALFAHVSKRCGKPVDKLLVEDLSHDGVLSFLDFLENERNRSIRTRNVRLAAVMSLANYIAMQSPEHVAWYGTLRAIPQKKAIVRQITYLNKEEIDAIVDAPTQSTALGFRDHVLLRFLYNTGARADEVAQLKVGHVRFGRRKSDTSIVAIMGKGRRQRQCPLWSVTADELRSLVGSRTKDAPLFVNRQGNPITRFGIYELVVRYAKIASGKHPAIMEKRPSPHTIRHTTATHLLQAGVDINTVRAWLGHSSVETTNVYAEVGMEAKIEAIGKCLPARGRKRTRHWRDDEKLMAFLDSI